MDITHDKGAAQGLMSATDTAIQHVALQGSDAEAPVLGQASGSAAFDDSEAADAKVQICICSVWLFLAVKTWSYQFVLCSCQRTRIITDLSW